MEKKLWYGIYVVPLHKAVYGSRTKNPSGFFHGQKALVCNIGLGEYGTHTGNNNARAVFLSQNISNKEIKFFSYTIKSFFNEFVFPGLPCLIISSRVTIFWRYQKGGIF
jgi:hypothetical protein